MGHPYNIEFLIIHSLTSQIVSTQIQNTFLSYKQFVLGSLFALSYVLGTLASKVVQWLALLFDPYIKFLSTFWVISNLCQVQFALSYVPSTLASKVVR